MNKLKLLVCAVALVFALPVMAEKDESSDHGRLFDKADKNGDGKVTREEYLEAWRAAAEKSFDRMDMNKDNVVDKDEAAKARSKAKAKLDKRRERAPEGK